MAVTVGVLTISTRGFRGEQADASGTAIKEDLIGKDFVVRRYDIVSDDITAIQDRLYRWSDEDKLNVIITTGGTGLGPYDLTPEATLGVIEREAPGIAEAMRAGVLAAYADGHDQPRRGGHTGPDPHREPAGQPQRGAPVPGGGEARASPCRGDHRGRGSSQTPSPLGRMMRFHLLTLFPGFFDSPLQTSILGRAVAGGILDVRLYDIRNHTDDRHRTADDYLFGGGSGMLMKVAPLARGVEAVRRVIALEASQGAASAAPVILLSPQGRSFNQGVAEELAAHEDIVLICGHYEGVDERVRERVATDEISLGDFVVTGGEAAAVVIIDAVARPAAGRCRRPPERGPGFA